MNRASVLSVSVGLAAVLCGSVFGFAEETDTGCAVPDQRDPRVLNASAGGNNEKYHFDVASDAEPTQEAERFTFVHRIKNLHGNNTLTANWDAARIACNKLRAGRCSHVEGVIIGLPKVVDSEVEYGHRDTKKLGAKIFAAMPVKDSKINDECETKVSAVVEHPYQETRESVVKFTFLCKLRGEEVLYSIDNRGDAVWLDMSAISDEWNTVGIVKQKMPQWKSEQGYRLPIRHLVYTPHVLMESINNPSGSKLNPKTHAVTLYGVKHGREARGAVDLTRATFADRDGYTFTTKAIPITVYAPFAKSAKQFGEEPPFKPTGPEPTHSEIGENQPLAVFKVDVIVPAQFPKGSQDK